MMSFRIKTTFGVLFAFSFVIAPLRAQRNTGEVRLYITDPKGDPVRASCELDNEAVQYRQAFTTGSDGYYVLKSLPFGFYRLRAQFAGLASYAETFEVRSEIPRDLRVALRIAGIETTVMVENQPDLVDPHSTGGSTYINSQAVAEHAQSRPGRAVLDMVSAQPGWLLEANGVLHPRGSEYQTQYVLDGLPITDNRSPAFAPPVDSDDVQAMTVLTANIPAEYGRKLGGIIEIRSPSSTAAGLHFGASLGAGSFGTRGASANAQFAGARDSGGVAVEGGRTDRYLDPPVIENFTNGASSRGVRSYVEHSFSSSDSVHLGFTWKSTGFLVPNERLQDLSGQRQDRNNAESMGQVSWQHIISPRLLLNARGMVRDLSSDLRSNQLSTPIIPSSGRGFRDGYSNISFAGHNGPHEWKIGADAVFTNLHDRFEYRITNPDAFDPGTQTAVRSAVRGTDREQSAYAQDLWRLGRFTLSAGLRFDHYRLLVRQSAWSPRLGVAYALPELGLVLRGSYDRVYQTPANEGLLVSSSPSLQRLNGNVLSLPVRPSHGNYYQAGFAKSLASHLRIEGNWYLRDVSDFADDDVLLNTGVTFPISFSGARIRGLEARVEIPRWGPFSASVAYSNMIGIARLPITGGLFLQPDAGDELNSADRFPISQDQRNTLHGMFRAQLAPRLWISTSGSYGSGLPVEIKDPDYDLLRAQYGEGILQRVDFVRGRVRPSVSLDTSLGADLWKHEGHLVVAQAYASNLTDRLNLINFAGLFSGTAVAAPRNFGMRLRFEF